jgi:hypothetical protein
MKKLSKLTTGSAVHLQIRDAFDFCKVHEDDLTPWQGSFVKGLKSDFVRRGDLTEKQLNALFDLVKSLTPEKTLIIRNYQ